MALINIEREHQLPLDELQKKIEDLSCDFKTKFDLVSFWEDNCLFFKRKGASGSIEISTTKIELNLTLGLAFKALANQIEREVLATFNQHL